MAPGLDFFAFLTARYHRLRSLRSALTQRMVVPFLLILIFWVLGSNLILARPHQQPSDSEILQRSDLVVIAHVKEGSTVYVPFTIEGGAAGEYNATLVVTEVIKGMNRDRELPIVIEYPLNPEIVAEGTDGLHSYRDLHSFAGKRGDKYLDSTSIIQIYELGSPYGGVFDGDIRKDQIWFLRVNRGRLGTPKRKNPGAAFVISDREDIQFSNLKVYFQALLTDHPEEKIKQYSAGDSPLAIRCRAYLDHLEMEEIVKEPDLTKRADLLIPFFLFTEWKQVGPTQREATQKLWACGEAGAARLVPIFTNPKYREMQTNIMMEWEMTKYRGAVPILADLLKEQNGFWASQTPAEINLWVDMGPTHSPTMPQIASQNRISGAILMLQCFADPRSKPILEETRDLWKKLFGPNAKLVSDCEQALWNIQNAEEERWTKNGAVR